MNQLYLDIKEVSEYLDILRFAQKTNTAITTELLMKFISQRKEQGRPDVDEICFGE